MLASIFVDDGYSETIYLLLMSLASETCCVFVDKLDDAEQKNLKFLLALLLETLPFSLYADCSMIILF